MGNLKSALKTVQNYHTINFPVFKLPGEPQLVDGLLVSEGRLIDDTNVEGNTLGARRLKSPVKLSIIKTYRKDLVDLIKDSMSTEEWYIDYIGNVFRYRKTTTEKVRCHKITSIMYRDTYSIITVKGVNFPIIVDSPPTGSYAKILYFGDFPWKLYDIVPEVVPAAFKKV